MVTCIGTNGAADQYIAIALPGRMFSGAGERHGLSRLNLSRTLEDSATLTPRPDSMEYLRCLYVGHPGESPPELRPVRIF